MTELNCNHECLKCPAWTLSGETSCIIINQVMRTARMETKVVEAELRNETKKVKTNENI